MKIRLPSRKPGPPLKRPPQLKLKASVARSRRAPIVEEEDFLEEPEPNMRLSHAFVVVLVLHVIAVAGVFAFNSIKAGRAEIFSAIKEEPAKAATASEPTDSDLATGNENSAPAPAEPMATANSIAPVAAVAVKPEPAASATSKTHELQPGETLTKVAATYGVSIGDLEKANGITDPTKIRAGEVLTLPAASSAPVAAPAKTTAAASIVAKAPEAASTSTVKDSGKIYTVVKGDNPVKIAKRLKVSYAALLSLNGNFDPRKMQIGQKLKIPAAAK
jgi:LysM repeat protein